MSDLSAAIASSAAMSQAAATRQSIQTSVVKQQAESEQAIADLLKQSADQQKATLAAGQGQALDILI